MLESNKFLAVLLVGAMIVSVTGTVISMNRIGSITVTGFASEAQGDVMIEILSAVSITTIDNPEIDFGTCTPSTESLILINSEGGEQTSNCTGEGWPNPILVRNDGNVDAEVELLPSTVGQAQNETSDFLPSADLSSTIEYMTLSRGEGTEHFGGCYDGLVNDYTLLLNSTDYVPACANLTHTGGVGGNNSFAMHVQIGLPRSAEPGESSVTLTFQATGLDIE